MIVLIPISVFMNGWALSLLWGWFISPPFGIPTLTIMQAFGVALVCSFVAIPHKSDSRDEKTRLSDQITNSTIIPIVAVGIGWVVRQFV